MGIAADLQIELGWKRRVSNMERQHRCSSTDQNAGSRGRDYKHRWSANFESCPDDPDELDKLLMDQPKASSAGVRSRMQQQRIRDTAPEMALRSELWGRGLRYRVHFAPVPGIRRRADIVFTKAQIAVFVDGCFWHRCPKHGSQPKANRSWWDDKLSRTVERDRDTDRLLKASGWRVIRVWEHEAPDHAAGRIMKALALRTA